MQPQAANLGLKLTRQVLYTATVQTYSSAHETNAIGKGHAGWRLWGLDMTARCAGSVKQHTWLKGFNHVRSWPVVFHERVVELPEHRLEVPHVLWQEKQPWNFSAYSRHGFAHARQTGCDSSQAKEVQASDRLAAEPFAGCVHHRAACEAFTCACAARGASRERQVPKSAARSGQQPATCRERLVPTSARSVLRLSCAMQCCFLSNEARQAVQ
jgi:hypothetical protein